MPKPIRDNYGDEIAVAATEDNGAHIIEIEATQEHAGGSIVSVYLVLNPRKALKLSKQLRKAVIKAQRGHNWG